MFEFAEDRPAVYFQYRKCVRKFLWHCSKTELVREYYDLTDPAVRRRFRDAGMRVQVWEKP